MDEAARRGCYGGAVKSRRHTEILALVRAGGVVSVDELAEGCAVSSSTIRRDLHELDRDGALARVRGGAALPSCLLTDLDTERPFADVARSHHAEKDAVARRAAALVADGETVLLDIGTTTRLLARRLRGRRVTVVTNSLAVLDELRDDEVTQLVLLGGQVRRPYHSLVGVLAEDALRQVRVGRAFLGTSGVDATGAVLDTTLVEIPVKRALAAAAAQVVLLADRHKLPGTGSLRVCGADELDVIITNEGADPAVLDTCREAGVEVLLA